MNQKEENLISVFATLFQNQMSIRSLYLSAKIDSSNLPVLEFPQTPYEYWEKVLPSLTLDDILDLIRAAYKLYPGNSFLKFVME